MSSKDMTEKLKEAVDARICWDRTHGHGTTHCQTAGCGKRSIGPDYAVHEIVALRSALKLRQDVVEAAIQAKHFAGCEVTERHDIRGLWSCTCGLEALLNRLRRASEGAGK